MQQLHLTMTRFIQANCTRYFLTTITTIYSSSIKNYSVLHKNKNNKQQLKSSKAFGNYGSANFESIRRNEQFYVDKTHFIPMLERSCPTQLILTRPPRFGKSLLLNTLKCYYDVNTTKEKFDTLFNGLYIHKNATGLQSSYHVLDLDFSIDIMRAGSSSNTPASMLTDNYTQHQIIKHNLNMRINSSIEMLINNYNLPSAILNLNSAESMLRLVEYFADKNENLMILIDEYDRFSNKLMFEQLEIYKQIVKGTTASADSLSSPIRTFFETLKKCSSIHPNFRAVTVGITPIALADASGANHMKDISMDNQFANILGFKEQDIEEGMTIAGVSSEYKAEILSKIKPILNGYYFVGTRENEGLYNPQVSIKFLELLQTKAQKIYDLIDTQANNDSWINLLDDENLRISNKVFDVVKHSPLSKRIEMELSDFNNFIPITGKLHKKITTTELIDTNDESKIYSFLFYHGIATLKAATDSTENISMKVPNHLILNDILARLKNTLALDSTRLGALFYNPTADNMHKLLWPFVEKIETTMGNKNPERELKTLFEICLKQQLQQQESSIKILTSKEIDIMFYHPTYDEIYLLELKRIRPNAIEYTDEEGKRFPLGTYWDDYVLQKCRNYLLKYSAEELASFQIRDSYHKYYAPSVDALILKAKVQLDSYATLLSQEPNYKDKVIHKFVVVQVGFPLIVKKLEQTIK